MFNWIQDEERKKNESLKLSWKTKRGKYLHCSKNLKDKFMLQAMVVYEEV